MRKDFSSLLLFLMLFQSWFNYKTVDFNSIPIKKKQNVEVKWVGGTYIKGTLVSKNEQTLILDTNGQLQEISVDEINEVKVRKFSIWKTAGGTSLSLLIGVLTIGVLLSLTALW